MTTNAIDTARLIVASDSRWSVPFDADHLAYVDDTGFDKIASRQTSCIVCAGDALLIQAWRDWFLQPVLNIAQYPPLNRVDNGTLFHIVFNVVASPDGILYWSGEHVNHDEARFAGSGANHARDCYVTNRCAKTAVGTASMHDPCTGGEIKFVELTTGESNLTAKIASIGDAEDQLGKRGHVMNLKSKEIYPFADFVAKSAASGQKIGALNLSAPTGSDAFVWSKDQERQLINAFAEIADREEEAKKR